MPPEVKPQPQISFHIFNSCTCSLWGRCYCGCLIHQIFLSISPSNVLFHAPCSGGGGFGVSNEASRTPDWRRGLIACFRRAGGVTSPGWSGILPHSHLHPRPSTLPVVLLCNVNGRLLFTSITSSRCVVTGSILRTGRVVPAHCTSWQCRLCNRSTDWHLCFAAVRYFSMCNCSKWIPLCQTTDI